MIPLLRLATFHSLAISITPLVQTALHLTMCLLTLLQTSEKACSPQQCANRDIKGLSAVGESIMLQGTHFSKCLLIIGLETIYHLPIMPHYVALYLGMVSFPLHS